MKLKTALKYMVLFAVLSVLLTGFHKETIYSSYINEPAELLLADHSDENYIWYSMGEYGENDASMQFVLLGGNVLMGTLAADKDTEIKMQAKKSIEAIKCFHLPIEGKAPWPD